MVHLLLLLLPLQMGRDGYKDVDYVLTTRELGRLLRFQKIDMASLPQEEYDNPMGTGSGGGPGSTAAAAAAAAACCCCVFVY
jgi:NADH-quinone oxidoreductase subunit G/NADP-reducing hydrogenase subunit HndD